MKIAFIGQKGIPAKSGGIEKHVEEIAVRMARLGHEVFVYVRDNYTDKDLMQYEGVKLIHMPSISTKHLDAISHTLVSSLHALLRPYDIVHYHGIGPTWLSWIIRLFRPGIALVATYHCQDYNHQKWGRLARAALRFGEYVTCKVPKRTIAVSEALAKYAQDRFACEAEVIPNGADVEYTQRTDALAKWGLKDKSYVVSVSRLVKHKGIHYLIEAFKQLEQTSKLPNNFKLVIVGDGFHTDDYVDYLHTISKGHPNIIFTGMQSGKSLQQLFSHAAVFVQPSESEGLSISLLEAMGYGLCVLTSDIPENKEVVADCGYSFKSKSVQDLRDKLAYVINRPGEVAVMGENARRRIERSYSWDYVTERILDTYAKMINKIG